MNGVAIELAKEGYSLVLEPFCVDLATRQFIEEPNFFKTLSVDGIIGFAGTYVPPVVDETIIAMGRPSVWLNRRQVSSDIPNICFNEEENGRILARYLRDRGHKNIAWLVRILSLTFQSITHRQARCKGVQGNMHGKRPWS